MDLERYAQQYKYVSREELVKLRQLSATEGTFETEVRYLNINREKEKFHGKRAVTPGPLLHILSVRIKPKEDAKTPLLVYGSIYAENFDPTYEVMVGHHLYKCDRKHAQLLDATASLTLNGPDFNCRSNSAIIPMFQNNFNVQLFDENDCFRTRVFLLR
ncbi:hypothetical protein RND81_07G006100 [Saponaria officinalis]|uniref:Uncharacterized protein n=1 Tax=Saponaria officinalis TaxID=3572 RepID=A0AAW1JL17_SAPOF